MIKSALQKLKNIIRFNPVYFNYLKKRHYKKYYVNPNYAKDKKILDTLIEDGVVIIPNFISDDQVKKIVDETKPHIDRILADTYDQTKYHRIPDFGVYRIIDIDTLSETSKAFFNNDLINSIAQAYVCPDVDSYQRMIEVRPNPGRASTADTWHFDTWKQRFKAFLYLTDVEQENAPFTYLKKSHKPGKWRNKREFEYYKDGHEGTHGHFFIQEINAIKEKYGFEEISCTAKKGTLILTDTRGLHKGTTLMKDRRLHLANYFDFRKD